MKCPKCNIDNPEEANFCMKCGFKFKEAEQPSPINSEQSHSYAPKSTTDRTFITRKASEGERKRLTMLFADLSGYTAMTERMDPEEVKGIMRRIFGEIGQVVTKYDGFVDRFFGDEVLIVFGIPRAHEDDPVRAVRAAMEIHDLVKNMSPQFEDRIGQSLEMHIGINTGLVVTGDEYIGKGRYGLTGDAINLAARLTKLAQAGETMVGSDTFRAAKEYFTFEPLKPVRVKGKEEPVNVFRVIAPITTRTRLDAAVGRRVFSEMVGRDKELDKLELQVMKAINGEGSIVNVIGEAGIGKSRLVSELRTSPIRERITLLEGRAISIGRNLSFHPIIDLLKHWAKINEEDSEVSALGKLETAIRNVCHQDANEVFPFVATLMGMNLTGKYAERLKGILGEALEKLILKNVKDLIVKSTEQTPLVIVIEDLHWADTSSTELLESLFRLAETHRVLFINVFRPNHPETGDRIVESLKEKLSIYYVEIKLEPLTEQMSETLVDNMLNIKGLHYGIKNRIVQQAGGNPFFIEEVVRSFIDEGAVIVKNGNFEVTDKIETMVIPHTINDVLMARIDRLEDKTRNLVKVASVIGRNFFHKILTEVSKEAGDIDSRLSYLKEIQLIRERKRLDELEYLFKHALAQEAAYASILHQKRKGIHLQVARSIEKVFKERLHEFYGMLAFHYSQAEDLNKTEEYLIKAGEESLRSSASAEALHFCQQALDLYLKKAEDKADPKKIAMLEKNIALALYNRGQYAESIPYFHRALIPYGATTPKHQITKILKLGASILAYISAIYFPYLYWKKDPTQEDNELFSVDYKKCAALAVIDPEEWFFQAFYFMRRFIKLDFTKIDTGPGFNSISATLFSFCGVSFTLSRRVLTFTKNKVDVSDVRSMCFYQCNVLCHNLLSGELKDEIEINQDLIDKNIAIGEFFYVTVYLNWAALVHIERGNFKAAHGFIQQLSDIAETYENDWTRVAKFINTGSFLLKCRRLHEAVNELQEGILFIERTGFRIWLIFTYSIKAWVQTLLGDFNGAEDSFKSAEKIMSEMMAAPTHVSHLFLGRFTFYIYQLEEAIKKSDKDAAKKFHSKALSAGKKALKVANKYSFIKIEALNLMGVYCWTIGKQRKALKWWQKAISEGERMRYRPELARIYFEIGKRLMEPNSKHKEINGITAEEYLNKAKNMFEEMDLQWDLDELDRLSSK